MFIIINRSNIILIIWDEHLWTVYNTQLSGMAYESSATPGCYQTATCIGNARSNCMWFLFSHRSASVYVVLVCELKHAFSLMYTLVHTSLSRPHHHDLLHYHHLSPLHHHHHSYLLLLLLHIIMHHNYSRYAPLHSKPPSSTPLHAPTIWRHQYSMCTINLEI